MVSGSAIDVPRLELHFGQRSNSAEMRGKFYSDFAARALRPESMNGRLPSRRANAYGFGGFADSCDLGSFVRHFIGHRNWPELTPYVEQALKFREQPLVACSA